MTEKLAYSIDEAAEALSLSRSAVMELIYTGKIKHVAVGRRKLIPRWALNEFLSATESAGTGPGADWDRMLESV